MRLFWLCEVCVCVTALCELQNSFSLFHCHFLTSVGKESDKLRSCLYFYWDLHIFGFIYIIFAKAMNDVEGRKKPSMILYIFVFCGESNSTNKVYTQKHSFYLKLK